MTSSMLWESKERVSRLPSSTLVSTTHIPHLVVVPTYSGYIQINAAKETFGVPYLGAPYNATNVQSLLCHTKVWPFNYATSVRDSSGTLNTAIAEYDTVDNRAKIKVWTAQASRYLRIDAVLVNTTFKPIYYGVGPHASLNVTIKNPDLPLHDGWLGIKTYGIVFQTGIGTVGPHVDKDTALNRTGGVLWDGARMAENGTKYTAKDRDYRVLTRALKYNSLYRREL